MKLDMAVTPKLRAINSESPTFNYKEACLNGKVNRAPRTNSALSSKEKAFDFKMPLTKALSVEYRIPAPANSTFDMKLERCVLLLSSRCLAFCGLFHVAALPSALPPAAVTGKALP
jgi:hypothetical protein